MSKINRFSDFPMVDVMGRRILEYVLDCLTKFNRGADSVILRAVSENVSKCVKIAHILSSRFGIKISTIGLKKLEADGMNYPALEVTLRYQPDKKNGEADYSWKDEIIEFPIYTLLVDSLLSAKGEIKVCKGDGTPLITIAKSGWEIKCKTDIPQKKTYTKEEVSYLNDIASVYYRCGLRVSPKWYEVAKILSQFDDVILGVDTNILHDCVLSEHLLNSLPLIDPMEYVHTPNWLLIIIPSSVMHEVEQAANVRNFAGFLEFEGRMGYRALQEILELDQSADLYGVSVIIVGETDPVLDTRVELQGLRKDLLQTSQLKEQKLSSGDMIIPDQFKLKKQKLSSGDMIIRDQFKRFLRDISFHKGEYFLTSDKSNAALAKTEGLDAIYYKSPSYWAAVGEVTLPVLARPPDQEAIRAIVPIGKLIYELAVEFCPIMIKWDDEEVEMGCDERGETLDHWIYRDLRINETDFEKLVKNYRLIGKFSLALIENVWNELTQRSIDEI